MEKYKSLRDSVIFQLKFDFGILLVLGAIISYLKLERNEIFQTTSEMKFFIIGISFLIVFGLTLERILSLYLVGTNDTVKEKKDLRIINKLMWAQFLMNILLVSSITSYSFGQLDTYITYKNSTELFDYLETQVQSYLTAKNCLPKNDRELIEFNNNIVKIMERLDIPKVKILLIKDPINEANMQIQFKAKLLSLIKEEFSKRKINFGQEKSLEYFETKYFDIVLKITEEAIKIELPFEYHIVVPGWDNDLGTDDDFKKIVLGNYTVQRKFIYR